MTVGTAQFVGARLTEAREAFGLTKTALSELIGVTPMAVSQYESGPQTPRADVFERIVEKFSYPHSFFLRPVVTEEADPIFWRSNATATKVARQRALQRLKWVKQITAYLLQYFNMPTVSFPDFGITEGNFRSLLSADIENFAQQMRDHWNFGTAPIPDLILELENSGAIVSKINIGAETLDAFSQWSGKLGMPFVVLGKEHASAVRSRFDAAHELGHLVLHRDIDRKRVNSKEDWKLIETQAHRFGAAFLLPAKSFCDELWAPTLDGFLSLKDKWRVSVGMMIVRSKHVGIIDDFDSQRLHINYNRRGWRIEEPLDSVLKQEQPRLLRRSFQSLIQEGIRTKGQVMEDLALPAREIEELSATPAGFLTGMNAEIKAFPALKETVKQFEQKSGAEIVPLFGGKGR
jgi:Zn-dependent peptidase ImmA (M78 family)/transcriptional regulator with XRE-family HTH domain